MKKLLGILVLGLLFSNIAYANIFNCKIDDTDFAGNKVLIKLVIDVEDFNYSTLTTSRSNEFDFTSDDFILSSRGNNGSIIITSSNYVLKEGSFDLFVFANAKKGENQFFKAIFTEQNFEGLLHSVII